MRRILYAGDSTAAFNKIDSYPQAGLSQGLLWYTKDDVFVRSFAVNGRSTKSFIDEGRLKMIEDEIEDGDILLIGFGHNDEKENDPSRYAPAFSDYKDNLKKMIAVAKNAKAFPVIITSIARRNFDETGLFLPGSHGDYPGAAIETAAECGIPFIDLCSISEEYIAKIGDHASRPLFVYPKDNTHLSVDGAIIFAGFVAEGLRKLGAPYAELVY